MGGGFPQRNMKIETADGTRVWLNLLSSIQPGSLPRLLTRLLVPGRITLSRQPFYSRLTPTMAPRTEQDHQTWMQRALALAKNSPSKPSNFRVGAILVSLDTGEVIAEGYTLECEGNTHAEECCLIKLAEQYSTTEEGLADVVKTPHALYTTMEPCFKRLSGKLPCVERVLQQKSWIREVYLGVLEPEKFVGQNPGRGMLETAGIKVAAVPGFEKEILEVATAGHVSGA